MEETNNNQDWKRFSSEWRQKWFDCKTLSDIFDDFYINLLKCNDLSKNEIEFICKNSFIYKEYHLILSDVNHLKKEGDFFSTINDAGRFLDRYNRAMNRLIDACEKLKKLELPLDEELQLKLSERNEVLKKLEELKNEYLTVRTNLGSNRANSGVLRKETMMTKEQQQFCFDEYLKQCREAKFLEGIGDRFWTTGYFEKSKWCYKTATDWCMQAYLQTSKLGGMFDEKVLCGFRSATFKRMIECKDKFNNVSASESNNITKTDEQKTLQLTQK